MQPLPILLFALAAATLVACHQRPNTTAPLRTSDTSPKAARSEFHHPPHHLFEHHHPHHFEHHFGGHHLGGHYKEYEHYLLPVLIVLGLGVLVMPLLSVLMTTMVGNVPVTTLVSGRRKREAAGKGMLQLDDLLVRVGKAVEAFTQLQKKQE